MASERRQDWMDRSALKGRVEEQLADMLLVKELLRAGLLDSQQVKSVLSLRRQIGLSLAASLLLNGGISLDALTVTLQRAHRIPTKAQGRP